MKKKPTIEALHQANRQAWNEGAQHYSQKLEKTIANLKGGISSIHPLEKNNLGDLSGWCPKAIHLQCASGEDTLSLLLEGAGSVVGVDISDVHIHNARRTSEALNLPAEWHCCDILAIPESLYGQFDLVYTGRGAICWIHDLKAWAEVVFKLLKPGGKLHLLEDHPLTWLFDIEAETYQYTGANYFDHMEESRGWPSTYIGNLERPESEHSVKYERAWTIGEVFLSLKNAGLEGIHFQEHPEPFWDIFPNLRPEWIGRIPLTYTLMAQKGT